MHKKREKKHNYNSNANMPYTPPKVTGNYKHPTFNAIFLDVDGVIRINGQFKQDAILNLKGIIHQTNAYLVLSSNWRLNIDGYEYFQQLVKVLDKYGIQISDTTPDLRTRFQDYRHMSDQEWSILRANEIRNWIYTHQMVDGKLMKKWLAIDDLPLNLNFNSFVQTQSDVGLNGKKANQIQKKMIEYAFSITDKYHLPEWWKQQSYDTVIVGCGKTIYTRAQDN